MLTPVPDCWSILCVVNSFTAPHLMKGWAGLARLSASKQKGPVSFVWARDEVAAWQQGRYSDTYMYSFQFTYMSPSVCSVSDGPHKCRTLWSEPEQAKESSILWLTEKLYQSYYQVTRLQVMHVCRQQSRLTY